MRREEVERKTGKKRISRWFTYISILLVCKDFSFKKIQLRKKNSCSTGKFLDFAVSFTIPLFVPFVTGPVCNFE